MTTQLASVPRKLPAWSTVSTCYSLVARNLGQLVRIAWFLLLIMMPMYAVTYWLSWPWSSEATGDIGGLVNQLFTSLPSLIELPFLASIAVAWPPAAAPGAVCGHPVFSVRCSGLAVRCVVAWVVVLSTAPFYYSPSSSPGPIEIGLMLGLIWLGVGVIFLVLPRVSIALPAVALDERLTLEQAWRMSRGNSWRLALATLLCALPTLMIFVPLYWYFDWQPRTSSVILGTLTSLIEVLLVTIGVTLLSLAYRFFIQQPDGGPTPTA